MGFLDSLGKTVKSIGGAALAGPGVIYDMATSITPFNEPGSPDNFSTGDLLDSIAGRFKQGLDPFTNESTWTGKAFGETMHGLNWAYQNGVDEPLSTTWQVVGSTNAGDGIFRGRWFDGESWSKAYAIAQHQSFGKSVINGFEDPRDISVKRDYAGKTDDAGNPITPFSDNAFTKNHPLIANSTALGVDLGASWFLDPGVLVGKAASVGHTEYTLGKVHASDRAEFSKVLSGEIGTPRANRLSSRIDGYFKFINGENRTGKPLGKAEIYEITPELKRSPRGKAIAGLLGDALKIEDVTERENAAKRIFSVAIGDVSQIERLKTEIPGAQAISDSLHNILKQKTVDLQSQAILDAAVKSPEFRMAYQRQLDNLDETGSVTKFAERWKAETDAKLNADKLLAEASKGGGLDFVPGARPATTARLRKAQGVSTLDRVASAHDAVIDGASRLANRDSYSSVFQKSLYHVPVIFARPIGFALAPTTKAPRAIVRALGEHQYRAVGNLHDWETTTDQLNAMMHLGGVPDDVRRAELGKAYTALSEMDRKRAALRIEHVSMLHLAQNLSAKHGIEIDPGFIKAAMLDGQAKREATMAGMEGGRAYAATVDKTTGRRIDMFHEEDGVALSLPVLSAQGQNDFPLLDIQFAKRVASDAAWVKRLGDHSRAWRDTALEMDGLKGALARAAAVGDHSVVRRLEASIAWRRTIQDSLLTAASTMQRWWKLAVLFRLGYPQRVVTDDQLRIGAKMGYGTFLAANLPEASKNIAYNLFGRRREALANFKVLTAQRALLKDMLGANGLGHSSFTPEKFDELRQVTKTYLSKKASATARADAEARMRELDPDGYYAEYADYVAQTKAAAAEMKRVRKAVEGGEATQGELDVATAKWQMLADHTDGTFNPIEYYSELSRIDRLIDSGKRLPDKRHVGKAGVKLDDETTAEGVYGPTGGGYHAAAASTIKDDLVFNQAEETGIRLVSTGNHRVIPAVDGVGAATPGHLEVWANVLNHQFLSSPEMMAFVKGKIHTVDDFVKWIRQPENQHLLDRMEQYKYNPEGWGARVQQMFHDYIPSEKLRERVADGRVSAKDLGDMFPDPAARPDVHGQLTDVQTGRYGPTRYMSATIGRMFKYLSDVPTDTLSRHPYMNAVYQRELKDAFAVRKAYRTKTGEQFTPEDLQEIQYTARNKALKELKSTLWDVSAHSHAAETMKFVSPFFAAHQEALNRWWGIVKDDPSVVRRFQLAFDAPRRAGLTYNPETGEVYAGDNIGQGNRIMIRLPGQTRGMFKWVGALGGSDDWSVSENGMNLILQNGVTNPGVGPLVSIPMEALVQKYADKPQLLAAARVLNQYPPQSQGLVGITEQSLMPAWARNFTAYAAQQEIPVVSDVSKMLQDKSDIYGRLFAQNYTDALIDFEKTHGGRTPTDAEFDQLAKETGHHTNVDLLLMSTSNALAFTPMRPESKYAVVQHGLQRIQEQARQNGEDQQWVQDQFKKQYKDIYLPMIQSLGTNPARLSFTAGEVSAIKQNRSLLNNLSVVRQRMVIGPEAAMDAEADPAMGMYSDAARNYAKSHEVQPGTGENYSGSRTPRDAALRVIINQGWEKYDELTNALMVVAESQGLTSYTESKQLMAVRSAGLQAIQNENFAFRDDYQSGGRASYDAALDDMKQIASNKRLLNNPLRSDVKVLKQYLQVRDLFTHILEQRAAAGGPKTMTAQGNDALQQAYAQAVSGLIAQNTYFATYMYNGVIEFDPYLTGAEVG